MKQEREERDNNVPFEVSGKSKGNNGVLVRQPVHIPAWQGEPHALTSHQDIQLDVCLQPLTDTQSCVRAAVCPGGLVGWWNTSVSSGTECPGEGSWELLLQP